MILSGFTGWKPVPLTAWESKTPPGHRLKTCATINFLAASLSPDRGGLFLFALHIFPSMIKMISKFSGEETHGSDSVSP
jgi:hypothetical protein